MATAVLKDPEYDPGLTTVLDVFPPPSGSRKELSQSYDSDSDSELSEPKQLGKRKHKSHHAPEEEVTQRKFLLDPQNIIHPRSTEWVPGVEVDHYVQDRLRRSFNKDVRKLHAGEDHQVLTCLGRSMGLFGDPPVSCVRVGFLGLDSL
ncbi:hypothetical protein NDU88_000060 [Pleurodeles waltl]|uniref:Uncharacterized protein n=1 Tax=Pleurodeles waltl TaxID=8319 RepID=A0AAV7U2E0_PLEWA|nr:hypothetical protein NDU88_000060 [Pleurodeles waltl]